jgi:DNA-binding NarL/FixJ family response regulator
MDGIEATRRLTGQGDDGPRVLVLTTFDLDEYVYDALRFGASGFLLKDVAAERLFDAVRVVAAGDALLASAVTRRLIGEFARLRRTQRPVRSAWRSSPRARPRCSASSPKGFRTPRSPNGSWSARRRSRRM